MDIKDTDADTPINASQESEQDPGLPALGSNASPALTQFAVASLKAARAHRIAAGALDAAAKGLDVKMAEIQATLDDLALAKTAAQEEAKTLRGTATTLSLEGLRGLSEASGTASTVATRFQQVDLAATRKYSPKDRENWVIGDRFDLTPDPLNPFDPNAIKVMRNGVHVGFIAKEIAAELKEIERKEGWSLAGPAFLHARKGGKWNEGTLSARFVNPVLGWEGYNPSKPLAQNLAAMESEALSAIAPAPCAPRKASMSL